jgi:hypothetical protein
VRETHYVWKAGNVDGSGRHIAYRATDPDSPCTWTPSIHMPRWASRITLRITDVRVERLQDISEEDAKAEGAAFTCDQCGNNLDLDDGAEVHAACDRESDDGASHKIGYKRLWESINGKRAPWAANPWVFALTFEVLK